MSLLPKQVIGARSLRGMKTLIERVGEILPGQQAWRIDAFGAAQDHGAEVARDAAPGTPAIRAHDDGVMHQAEKTRVVPLQPLKE